MRRLILVLIMVSTALFALAPSPTSAACANQTLQEQYTKADAVVYGTVVDMNRTRSDLYATITVEQVYRGSVRNPTVLRLPVDDNAEYPMQKGTDHTLYLTLDLANWYGTDACSGSHPGKPAGDELTLLGPGQAAPSYQTRGSSVAWGEILSVIVAAGLGTVGISLLSRLRRKRARR